MSLIFSNTSLASLRIDGNCPTRSRSHEKLINCFNCCISALAVTILRKFGCVADQLWKRNSHCPKARPSCRHCGRSSLDVSEGYVLRAYVLRSLPLCRISWICMLFSSSKWWNFGALTVKLMPPESSVFASTGYSDSALRHPSSMRFINSLSAQSHLSSRILVLRSGAVSA
jgi:hypothetical protein